MLIFAPALCGQSPPQKVEQAQNPHGMCAGIAHFAPCERSHIYDGTLLRSMEYYTFSGETVPVGDVEPIPRWDRHTISYVISIIEIEPGTK
jgi:hypothetical protein